MLIAELGSSPYPFTRQRLVDYVFEAYWIGDADAVKVQLFRAENFPVKERSAKRRLEFPRHDFKWLVDQTHRIGLKIGASVFDFEAVDLCASCNTDFVKLATREQHNDELRDYVHRTYHGTIIRSVLWPLIEPVDRREREVTLACVPRYPTVLSRGLFQSIENLNMLPEPYGWSSHTTGVEDCLRAVHNGAQVIEKHFALAEDDLEAGWSLLPDDFALMAGVL